MKNYLLIMLVACPAWLYAQSFTAVPGDTLESTNDVNDWLSDYIYLQNNSGTDIAFSFQTLSNTMNAVGWDPLLCTNVGCTPYVPASGSMGTVADGDEAYFNLHVGFQGIPGTGEIRFRVYETGNPTNADTVTFLYHVAATTGLADKTAGSVELSQNFPNPFSVTSTVRYRLPSSNGFLEILDVTGRRIATHELTKGEGTATVGEGLAKGIFYCTLADENGNRLATRKLTVQ